MDRAASVLPKSSKRFTDEQIFAILRAAEGERDGTPALCEAQGVTVPMYCLWKVRYGKLTLDELRQARALESRRAFTRHALLAAGIIVTLTVALSITAWVSRSEAVTAAPSTTVVSRTVAPAAPVASGEHANLTASTPQAAALPRNSVPAAALEPPTDAGHSAGYSVQLAAVPDVREASEKLERLKSAGYTAYLLPMTSGDVTLYRVRVGPFDSLVDAHDAVRGLKRDGYEGAWISK